MSLRFQVVSDAFKKHPLHVETPSERPSEYFGKYVFNQKKMFEYLPLNIYKKLRQSITEGTPLDLATADEIARGMKKWAIEMGATHCTHWFQPLTEGTAEKHDAFVEHDFKGGMVEEFSGKQLVQLETDASSFPSGGIRSTFEARGYSAWDPASPVFILGDTLMIPTVFISFTGEALDYKAPLKKSLAAIDKASTAVARLFNPDVQRVTANLGWEQEYFLVDDGLYAARPDLVLTGRTLMGHESSKNQQMDDHYFGAIPDRVQAYMQDLEIHALELGIPCKTRHNEVAPNQFEFAPIFEETNLACDHNMLLMTLMKKVAHRHGLCCLLHEKPFKGVNGSGKHCNFSLQSIDGEHRHNLMAPGHTEDENLMFITFVVNTLAAVCRHNGLLKASIMNASNACRLGGHEAPPAIISSFIGRGLSEVLDALEHSNGLSPIAMEGKHGHSLDIPQIPELMIDNTDRNRTSPFAFNGNRFEFRAVGSEANCACSMIVLNTAVAEQLTEFRESVNQRMAEGMTTREAVMTEVRKLIVASKAIRFDGNGYSEEWEQEARRRGLNCETSAPLIFDAYMDDASVSMFERMGVMRRTELEARNEIKWEMYVKKVQIESRVLCDMGENHVVPAALDYKGRLVNTIYKANTFGACVTDEMQLVAQISDCVSVVRSGIAEMRATRKRANAIVDMRARAIAYHDEVLPLMASVRKKIDKLEEIVDDNLWPLPKYRELLFSN